VSGANGASGASGAPATPPEGTLGTPGTPGVTRVMLVDDQRLFRRGVQATLAALPDVEIVGETQNDDDALQAVAAARPDVVVLGELGGGWDVFAATLRRELPRTGLVVLLDHVVEEDLFFALKAGACACRPRVIDGPALVDVVRQAARGECVIHMSDVTGSGPSRRIMARPGMAPEHMPAEPVTPCPLSDREMEILAGVAEGCSNKEIGQRCGISDQTVKNHLTTVLRKLGVGDRTEAVVIALRNRWLKLESIKLGREATEAA